MEVDSLCQIRKIVIRTRGTLRTKVLSRAGLLVLELRDALFKKKMLKS